MKNGIEAFLSSAKRISIFTDFEGIMRGMEQRVPQDISQVGSKHIARCLYEFARDHFYMMLVIERKLSEIARGIKASDADKNISVFMNLARSFFEHSASFVYQSEILRKGIDDVAKKRTEKDIVKAIGFQHDRLKKLFYSSGKSGEKVHVNTMIETAAKIKSDFAGKYADLCEFVHPNYGSNRLVSTGTLGAGKIEPAEGVFETERNSALSIIDDCVEMIFESEKEVMRQIVMLDSRITIALMDFTKPEDIFVDKQRIIGDGKSKETAYFFSNARTHGEAVKALYAFVEKNKFTKLERENHGVDDDGYLYESITTESGSFWVKYKMLPV